MSEDLNEISNKLELLASLLHPILSAPEQVLLDYGERSTGFFIVVTGTAREQSRWVRSYKYTFQDIKSNSLFGYVSFIFNTPSWVRVESKNYQLIGKCEKEQI